MWLSERDHHSECPALFAAAFTVASDDKRSEAVVSFLTRNIQAKWPSLSVYLSLAAFLHYYTDSGVTLGCPLVVHYWADLQLVHGFCCYGSIRA